MQREAVRGALGFDRWLFFFSRGVSILGCGVPPSAQPKCQGYSYGSRTRAYDSFLPRFDSTCRIPYQLLYTDIDTTNPQHPAIPSPLARAPMFTQTANLRTKVYS